MDLPEDVQYDRQIIAAVTAEDLAGTALDVRQVRGLPFTASRHWMLHDSGVTRPGLCRTRAFVSATTALGDLSEPSKLRP